MVEATCTGLPHQRYRRHDVEEPINAAENTRNFLFSLKVVRTKITVKLKPRIVLIGVPEYGFHWLSPCTAPAPRGGGRRSARNDRPQDGSLRSHQASRSGVEAPKVRMRRPKAGWGGGYRNPLVVRQGRGYPPLETLRVSQARFARTSHLTVVELRSC
jgi:hypothetical protein